MRWGLCLLYFGLPAMVMAAAYYLLLPALIRQEMFSYQAYLVSLGLLLLGLPLASLGVLRLEGVPLTWSRLAVRFPYQPLSGSGWKWTGGILAVEMAGYLLMVRLTNWLQTQDLIPLPATLPAFLHPQTLWSAGTLEKAAGGLQGSWGVFWLTLGLLAVSNHGEEFWWRGVVFSPPGSSIWGGRLAGLRFVLDRISC
jgi:hypothetical protein